MLIRNEIGLELIYWKIKLYHLSHQTASHQKNVREKGIGYVRQIKRNCEETRIKAQKLGKRDKDNRREKEK